MKITRQSIFLSISILTLIASVTSKAEIYRSIDSDGHEAFSDTPSNNGQKMELRPAQVYTAPTVEKADSESNDANGANTPAAKADQNKPYDTITLTGIDSQSNLPFGLPISVNISSDPTLQTGDSYNILMDGKEIGPAQTNAAFSIPSNLMSRGQHTLQAVIVNSKKEIIKQSDPLPFSIFQPSILRPKPSA